MGLLRSVSYQEAEEATEEFEVTEECLSLNFEPGFVARNYERFTSDGSLDFTKQELRDFRTFLDKYKDVIG